MNTRPKNVWFRQHGDEYFSDPSYRTMSDAEFRLYHEIIALAVKANNQNDQVSDGRTGCTVSDIATMTGRTNKTCNVTLTLLEQRGLIKISENFQIFLKNFEKFFPKSLDSAKRVREWRAKRKATEGSGMPTLLQNQEGDSGLQTQKRCNVTVTSQSNSNSITITEEDKNILLFSSSNTNSARGEKSPEDIATDRGKVFQAIVAAAPNLQTANSILITEWLLDGCNPDLDILPTIERLCQQKRPGEIKGFKYFDAAIRQAKQDRESGFKPAAKQQSNHMPNPFGDRTNIDYAAGWNGLVN